MDEYRKPYLVLFAATEKALETLDSYDVAKTRRILIQGQMDAEEKFIEIDKQPEGLAQIIKIIKT